jgi:hypothetical protein
MTTSSERENRQPTFSSSSANEITTGNFVAGAIFLLAIGQFAFFTWLTSNQPIIDLWGFRTAQTAVAVPYILREGAWFATVVPVFGEPWVLPIEFPFYQWCVALLVRSTGAPIDTCGRTVSAFFAVATLWPVFLLAKSAGLQRRYTLIVGALWLLAPVVLFFGRSFLIETTTVFVSAVWLAFYVRFLTSKSYMDFITCLIFGVLAALVKITCFAGFIVVGFIYTCVLMWRQRERLAGNFFALLFAGGTVFFAAVSFTIWVEYTDQFMAENPLAALLRSQNLTSWYLGDWNDRWGVPLWNWTIRLRALPDALGIAWYVTLYGLARVGPQNRLFWLALVLLAGYLSNFIFFPKLHINHFYYQVENAILLCAVAATIIEALLQRRWFIEGYLVLAVIVAGQLWTFYNSLYFKVISDDLRKHPYYQASMVLRDVTPPNSVIVAFGTGYGADLPYFADRRGIILANWFPISAIRQVLFDERNRWFGGRKLGAVVDCAVYENQIIGPELFPIRDELKRELDGKTIVVSGSFQGATLSPTKCDISLPRE